LVFSSFGCVSTEPIIYNEWYFAKRGLNVKEVNSGYLCTYCLASTWDDGSKMNDCSKIAGCYLGSGQILIKRGYGCVLLHELCHDDELPPNVCKEFYNLCSQPEE